MKSREDVLGCLEPYFPDGVNIYEKSKIDTLHDIFCKDFFGNAIEIDGRILKVKPYPYSNHNKDLLPDTFSSYNEKFVHIVTRKTKATSWKTSQNIREFCQERANRIHWIRPILEHYKDKRITHFVHTESNGSKREYFWYRSKQYMVILEEIIPDYTLITGFCVDSDNQPFFQNKYINRKKQT